jgi:hypothetical protein
LARRPDASSPLFEQGEIGPDLFRVACKMGLDGMVSSAPIARIEPEWVKVKNRNHPAMSRVMASFS